MKLYDVFNFLKGGWKIYRTISNNGMMQGTANFIISDLNELFYREEGVFIPNVGLQTFKVYREYFYCYIENQICVFQAENNRPKNLLHVLKFIVSNKKSIPLKAHAIHICSNDIYQAVYSFFADKFQLQYNVMGPTKNYMIITNFDRISR